ncbi:MAG: DUF3656 domain-containing protein, partial [Verrucomicrobiota bacterium]
EGHGIEVSSSGPLEKAQNRPLTEEFLKQQLGRLGSSVYELENLTVNLEGEVMLRVSELNRMRRSLVEKLDRRREGSFRERRVTGVTLDELLPERAEVPETRCELRVLCRSAEQVTAALESGIRRLYVDFEDVRRYRALVPEVRAHDSEVEIFLATPRIQKAGETGLFRVVEKARPDGVLVRNLGGVHHFRNHADLKMVCDFSLNVANPISAGRLMDQGAENLTISYDLNIEQVLDLLRLGPPEWFELTLHQHMPMFHMEHCVFCTFLSEGTNFTNCGRPCDEHEVQLRDRVGQLHVLQADVGCRNTLFNGRAQSGARFFDPLKEAGLRIFRVELLEENAEETAKTISSYQALLAGEAGPEVLDQLRVDSRLGVVEGTLEAR